MTSREFEIYFRKMYLPLGMYALRIVYDADVAEDLEQDTFMKAWLYLEKGGEIDRFHSCQAVKTDVQRIETSIRLRIIWPPVSQ